MSESDEFKKFMLTIVAIETDRRFDVKVDRLKKSSSATTIWAILPGLIGLYGIAHFYLNRPIEGLIILGIGGIVTALTLLVSLNSGFIPYLPPVYNVNIFLVFPFCIALTGI